MRKTVIALISALVAACGLELDPQAPVIHARFDPLAKKIPMPTDILRDETIGLLDLPYQDADLTSAERELYMYLNGLDGWSQAMPATVEFTAPIAPSSLDAVEVWKWGSNPVRVTDASLALDDARTLLTIDAPRQGWTNGGTYVVLVRGGETGVKGAAGEAVLCDAAFYYLRLTTPLDDPEHEHAFPGDTSAERMQNARDLEEIRQDLAPYFDAFEVMGIARAEVAALWSFTVTERNELAMDKASQRMPLPFDLLLDEYGHVDLPPAPWDSEAVIEAKERLSEYDGFATSAALTFELTQPVDIETVSSDAVALYELSDPPSWIPSETRVMDDLIHLVIEPGERPLKEITRYAVVVTSTLRSADGGPISTMPVGHFVRAEETLLAEGKSRVSSLDDADAERLERVRLELEPLWAIVDRREVIAAWPFTTLSITQPQTEWVTAAETVGVRTAPASVTRVTTAEAALDFPLAALTLFDVESVYRGTIQSPVFLDPVTRARRPGGAYSVEELTFTMTIPKSVPTGQPLGVVIFGHAILTEQRFVLAVADALARQGLAAIAIDLPYHGTRTHCVWSGPQCFPSPLDGELYCIDPCAAGSTCRDDGRCVDAAGNGSYLRNWPVLGYPEASGAAFVEVDHIASSKDHFVQALVDLGALHYSLRHGDWAQHIDRPIDKSRIYFVGQSLGAIIGTTFVASSPEIARAVLNVPGADTVGLFADSAIFGGHVDAFFLREGIEKGTSDAERFFGVARWFMDVADPVNSAQRLDERDVMIQMATLDVVIRNPYTDLLSEVAGIPHRDYLAEHVFLVIPAELEYWRGVSDMAGFLSGTFVP